MMNKSHEEQIKMCNRYELRLVIPHFSMQVVGIYQTLGEAVEAKGRQHLSNLNNIVIYDTIKQERV